MCSSSLRLPAWQEVKGRSAGSPGMCQVCAGVQAKHCSSWSWGHVIMAAIAIERESVSPPFMTDDDRGPLSCAAIRGWSAPLDYGMIATVVNCRASSAAPLALRENIHSWVSP